MRCLVLSGVCVCIFSALVQRRKETHIWTVTFDRLAGSDADIDAVCWAIPLVCLISFLFRCSK